MSNKSPFLKQDEFLNELFDNLSRIGAIESQSEQMEEMLKMKYFIAKIWEDGYNEGINAVAEHPLLTLKPKSQN